MKLTEMSYRQILGSFLVCVPFIGIFALFAYVFGIWLITFITAIGIVIIILVKVGLDLLDE